MIGDTQEREVLLGACVCRANRKVFNSTLRPKSLKCECRVPTRNVEVVEQQLFPPRNLRGWVGERNYLNELDGLARGGATAMG